MSDEIWASDEGEEAAAGASQAAASAEAGWGPQTDPEGEAAWGAPQTEDEAAWASQTGAEVVWGAAPPLPTATYSVAAARPARPARTRSSRRTTTPASRRRRVAATAVVAVVVLAAAGVGTAHALQGTSGDSYRTAVATQGSVVATLTRSGTIEPVAQASVSFPMSGRVATVPVSMGQTVTTGQVLATLDATTLQSQLTSKQATLAQAQLVVAQAETAQTSATSSSSGSTSSSGSGGASGSSGSSGSSASSKASGSGTGSSGSNAGSSSTMQEAAAVTSAQQQVDQDLQAANVAVQSVTTTCGSSTSTTATGSNGAGSGAGTSDVTSAAAVAAATRNQAASEAASIENQAQAAVAAAESGTNASAGAGAGGGASGANCTTAIQQALVAQQNLASAESALAKAESALQTTLNQATSTSTSASGSGAGSVSGGAAGSQSTSSSAASGSTTSASSGGSTFSGSGSQSSTAVPSAADLVADQAAVDADQAQVSVAQQQMDEATIVSPINGSIVQVGLNVGQQVSAQSSTASIIVVGQGGWEVATTVPVANLTDIKVGDTGAVVPDGVKQILIGKVVEIGVAPASSGSSNYPVVIGFTASPTGLENGASATVTIDTAEANEALTVPTSAVHVANGVDYVTTLTNGKPANTFVQIGAIGADRTEIRTGLQAGAVVVLADMNTPLPSATTQSQRIATNAASGGGGGVVRFVGPAGG